MLAPDFRWRGTSSRPKWASFNDTRYEIRFRAEAGGQWKDPPARFFLRHECSREEGPLNVRMIVQSPDHELWRYQSILLLYGPAESVHGVARRVRGEVCLLPEGKAGVRSDLEGPSTGERPECHWRAKEVSKGIRPSSWPCPSVSVVLAGKEDVPTFLRSVITTLTPTGRSWRSDPISRYLGDVRARGRVSRVGFSSSLAGGDLLNSGQNRRGVLFGCSDSA